MPAGDDDARAEPAERARNREAEARAAAGHERGLSVEDARANISSKCTANGKIAACRMYETSCSGPPR